MQVNPRSGIVLVGTALAILGGGSAVAAADVARGSQKFSTTCAEAECHHAANLKGPAGAAFTEKLGKIASGATRHRPRLKLTADEVADLDAYVATLK